MLHNLNDLRINCVGGGHLERRGGGYHMVRQTAVNGAGFPCTKSALWVGFGTWNHLIRQVFSRISPSPWAIIFDTRSYDYYSAGTLLSILTVSYSPRISHSSLVRCFCRCTTFRHLLYFISTLPISHFPASKQTMYAPPSIRAFFVPNLMYYVVMN